MFCMRERLSRRSSSGWRVCHYATTHSAVIAGHSRPKDGVASLAYVPAIYERIAA
ncbi:MAG: hypothetical protein K2Y27_03035 [Xanthobacteraceae bacterium]|nr:hypothetical protein [Xanthobacteraceae bacterium]